MKKDEKLEELKREVIKALLNNDWDKVDAMAKESKKDKENKENVTLKKEPVAIAMRILKPNEDCETQIMNECELFFKKHGVYPNGIVMNPATFDRWEDAVENCVIKHSVDSKGQGILFDDDDPNMICEFKPTNDKKGTLFATPKYEILLIENEEYQDGVYQLFNGYSPTLENGKFSYPVINMVETGKKIRELADEKGIAPTEIQKVCGLGSLQAVYKWFGGKSVPSIDNLGIISNLLNTPIDDIVVFENRKE